MSKYSSKNSAFQFGLLLFTLAGLSIGIILTTGKASLIFSPSAQIVKYSIEGQPCRTTDDTCSNGNIYDCVEGKQKLIHNCVQEGFSGCQIKSGGYIGPSCVYKNGDTCIGNKSFCRDGILFGCKNGDAALSVNCKNQGKTCGLSNGKIDCYMMYPTNTTTCRDGVIYDCKAGQVCTVKQVCRNGCYPDGSEVPRVYKTPTCIVRNTRLK